MLIASPNTREGALSDGPQTLAGFAAGHSVALIRFAYLLSGDRQTAEDLVQEALLGMFRRFGDSLAVVAPMAYARRAILNAHLSRSRRRSAAEIVTDTVPEVASVAVLHFPAVTAFRTVTSGCGAPCRRSLPGNARCW